jgi:hypothetical protein
MERYGRTGSHSRRKFRAQIPEAEAARYRNPHLTARSPMRLTVSRKAENL